MIDAAQLESAAEQLRVYDVDQGAWEGDADGFEANAERALHLLDVMSVRDFSDPELARSEAAPDSVRYALRLMRWTGQGARMANPTRDQVNIARILAARENFKSASLSKVAFIESAEIIARQLHDFGDESARPRAVNNRLSAARQSGRLLVYSAHLQAEQFEFDLFEAFDARLVDLSERLEVPAPAS